MKGRRREEATRSGGKLSRATNCGIDNCDSNHHTGEDDGIARHKLRDVLPFHVGYSANSDGTGGGREELVDDAAYMPCCWDSHRVVRQSTASPDR